MAIRIEKIFLAILTSRGKVKLIASIGDNIVHEISNLMLAHFSVKDVGKIRIKLDESKFKNI